MRRGAPAFTLIEVLVVTLILALAIGAIAACIASGVKVWERAQSLNTLERETLMGLETLERDVRNTFLFYDIGFSGDAIGLSMPGLVAGASDGPDEFNRVVGTISYAFDVQQEVLFRTVSIYDPDAVIGGPAEALAQRLKTVRFSYVEGDRQTDAWQSKTNLPDRIDVSITALDGLDEVEIRRVIVLPVTNRFEVSS